jgi:hypothetical protein
MSQNCACYLLVGFCHDLFFDPEDEGNMFLENNGGHLTDYTVLHLRR